MFSQATVIIDREPDEVYEVLSHFKTQLTFWESLHVPGLNEMAEDETEAHGTVTVGQSTHSCIIVIHHTRPKSGLVTRMQTMAGELAAEFRVMSEGNKTKVEVNVEGHGGGPASSISIRQFAPRILLRLKQYFDRA